MTHLRFEKIERIANDIPDVEVYRRPEGGDLLVLGWGSTYGVNRTAVQRARAKGKSVSQAHLRHLNPFPKNLGEVLKPLQEGPHPGEQHGPAACCSSAASSWSMPSACTGSRAGRSRSPRSKTKIHELVD